MAKTLNTEPVARKVTPNPGVEIAPRLRANGPKPRETLPAFLDPQNPKLVAEPPQGAGWRHELKFDGYRMQLSVRRGEARWFSRNGHDWTDRMRDFAPDVAELDDCTLDGELCALDAKGHPDFSALRSHMGSRQRGRMTGDLTFFAFDILTHNGDDMRGEQLSFRLDLLSQTLEDVEGHRIREVTDLPGGGPELLKAACRMGLEGIVSKRLDAVYSGGEKRLLTWVKSKCRPSQEVVIGGWEVSGSGLRSILTGVFENGQLRYVGSVGTGFTQTTAGDLLKRLRAVEADGSPFAVESPRKSSSIHWTRPELVAAIEIAEWTASGKIRQASYKGLREDKEASAVMRERPAN